ncbi:MAG: RING finger protein [Oscillospiraceae bacterium]
MSYDGEKCPICAKEFTEDDDVVVCPICGTPHHRSCYLNNKDCANVGLHASGYIYEKSALIHRATNILLFFAQTVARKIRETSLPAQAVEQDFILKNKQSHQK